MIAMIREQRPVRETREIVRMIVNYVDTIIRPVLAYATPPVDLPPIDVAALYEHLDTSQHTLNSRLAVMNTARLVEQVMHTVAASLHTREGGNDLAAVRVFLQCAKMNLAIHQVNPSRLAFGGGTDTDLAIDTSRIPLAAASATARLHRTQNPFLSRFLQDYHHTADTSAAAAGGNTDLTMEQDEDENV